MSNEDLCPLCGDLSRDPMRSGIMRLYGDDALPTAIMWESAELYLTPGPGTIMPGYLILATKRHLTNFAHLSDRVLAEAWDVVEAVARLGGANGLDPYLLFEHGSGDEHARGASCIEHAHMHLAPSPAAERIRELLAGYFRERSLSQFNEIRSLKGGPPYVFLSFSGGFYVYETICISSQFVRRILAAERGIPKQWRWSDHPLPENFWKTYALFNGKLGSPAGIRTGQQAVDEVESFRRHSDERTAR